MKFYRIDWTESEPTAQQTDWATSKREAERLASMSCHDARVTEVEVPTDRKGLLAFLRENIWCDAGRAIHAAEDR